MTRSTQNVFAAESSEQGRQEHTYSLAGRTGEHLPRSNTQIRRALPYLRSTIVSEENLARRSASAAVSAWRARRAAR
jgi:hypothetical protein